MACCTSYTARAFSALTDHFSRAVDKNGSFINSEGHIDKERSHLNYNLAPDHGGMSQKEFYDDRTRYLICRGKKDGKKFASWVITATPSVRGSDENLRAFFKSAYDFCEGKYGSDNVVSAYVHMDEVTPHMHFCFVPIVTDKATGLEKVLINSISENYGFWKFHPELDDYLAEHLGEFYKRDILNGATRDGNLSVNQLKLMTKVKEAEKCLAEAEEVKFKAYIEAQNIREQAQKDSKASIDQALGDAGNIRRKALEDAEAMKGVAQTAIRRSEDMIRARFSEIAKSAKALASDRFALDEEKARLKDEIGRIEAGRSKLESAGKAISVERAEFEDAKRESELEVAGMREECVRISNAYDDIKNRIDSGNETIARMESAIKRLDGAMRKYKEQFNTFAEIDKLGSKGMTRDHAVMSKGDLKKVKEQLKCLEVCKFDLDRATEKANIIPSLEHQVKSLHRKAADAQKQIDEHSAVLKFNPKIAEMYKDSLSEMKKMEIAEKKPMKKLEISEI
ncbi:MAG: plasmid recombination protein [Clostridiales bacterium]|jgi:hypothetical protein|nr:plasmid recombination protein [Clostridiales bacterium]